MKFNVVIEKDEDGYYVAMVPALPGCNTQAKSLDELLRRIREALELYLVVERDREIPGSGTFVGVQVIELEAG